MEPRGGVLAGAGFMHEILEQLSRAEAKQVHNLLSLGLALRAYQSSVYFWSVRTKATKTAVSMSPRYETVPM